MDKRSYYQDEKIVANYVHWRFGSAGGQYVDATEKTTIIELLGGQKDRRILDMPCGTGRLLHALSEHGYRAIEGADASPAMLQLAAASLPDTPLREVDAFQTPYEEATFDCLCSLRFLFHLPEPERLFSEASRLLKADGVFIFDSLNWTPRNAIPLLNRWLGGRVYPGSEFRLRQLLERQGFDVIAVRYVFLLPTQAYRALPSWMVTAVCRLERWLPVSWRSKLFVAARKRTSLSR